MSLTEERCGYLVQEYLTAHDWLLVAPTELASQVWEFANRQGATPAASLKIGNVIARFYAGYLHDACCRPTHKPTYDRAWKEVITWMRRHVSQIEYDPTRGDEIVQESVFALQQRWLSQGLRQPQSLWSQLLNEMRSKAIDLQRKESAQKRGAGKVQSLDPSGDFEHEGDSHLDRLEQHPTTSEPSRIVLTVERHHRLVQYFEQHLPTQLQQQVATALFIDGLPPREIATLMKKQPSEVRSIKSRLVNKLQALPDEEKSRLKEILGVGGTIS